MQTRLYYFRNLSPYSGAFSIEHVGQDLNNGQFYAIKPHHYHTDKEMKEFDLEVEALKNKMAY
ncbi:MAG: hypothetical protein JSS07_02435 [Proteobacteria bacterium]|nr:hypothetical protein [Pseudomonadota bacterium]